MNFKSKSLKWVGFFSSAFLTATAFAPGTFHIPPVFRPWIFMLDLLWLTLVFSGFFTP